MLHGRWRGKGRRYGKTPYKMHAMHVRWRGFERNEEEGGQTRGNERRTILIRKSMSIWFGSKWGRTINRKAELCIWSDISSVVFHSCRSPDDSVVARISPQPSLFSSLPHFLPPSFPLFLVFFLLSVIEICIQCRINLFRVQITFVDWNWLNSWCRLLI